eukprot:2722950-Rhodomonas_salina.1
MLMMVVSLLCWRARGDDVVHCCRCRDSKGRGRGKCQGKACELQQFTDGTATLPYLPNKFM